MASASKEYKSLAKRYLRTFPQNEFMEDDALAGYAYVKIVAEAISKVGANSQRIAAYVHAQQHVQHPRVRVAAQVDAVGRDDRSPTAVRHPDQGQPAQAGLNTAMATFWPRVVFKSPALTTPRPPS